MTAQLKPACCSSMARQLNWSCDKHTAPAECPDDLIGRFKDSFGLLIHDGGTSYVAITHYPWCGAKLIPD